VVKVVSDATADGLDAALRYALRPDDRQPEAEPAPPLPAAMMATDAAAEATPSDGAPAVPPARRTAAAARRAARLVVLTIGCIAGGVASVAALHSLRAITTEATTPEQAAAPVSLPLAPPPPAEPESVAAALPAAPIPDATQTEPEPGDAPPAVAVLSIAEAAPEPETPAAAEVINSSPAAGNPSAEPEPAAGGTEPAAAAVTPPAELYVVQIAAYRTERTARRACDAIAQRGGFDLETVDGTAASAPGRTGGGGWFYCRSRRAMPLDGAQEMQRRLRAAERAEPLLLPLAGANDAG
jgi:hypothetical protein